MIKKSLCYLQTLLMTIAVFYVSSTLAAENTGSILGTVSIENSSAEDTTVTVLNLDTNQTRTIVSTESGTFYFSRLAPGKYEITATKDGYKKSTRTTTVLAGEGTTIHFDLVIGAMEEVIVIGISDSLLNTSSVEKSIILTATEVESLPVFNNIESVALLTPGTLAGDKAFGNLVSFSGSSVAENTYYINGMNVTDFRRGLGGSSIPFKFYDQFQFKSGGFSAEYGRSTGGVFSGITKRGSNTWSASMGYITTPESLRSYSPNVPHPTEPGDHVSFNSLDKHFSNQYFVSVGGPLFNPHIYIYGIYQGRDYRNEDYSPSNRLYKSRNNDPFWGAKVDWILNNSQRIEFTAFSDENSNKTSTFHWDKSSGRIGSFEGDRYSRSGGQNFIVNYVGNFGYNFTVSVLAGINQYERSSRSLFDDLCPIALDSRSGQTTPLGCWKITLPGTSQDTRNLYRTDFEVALSSQHLLRFGLDYEIRVSEDKQQYSGPNGGESFRYYTVTPGTTLSNGGIVPDGITEIVRYRLYRRGGTFETTAGAWYFEDLWSVTNSVSLRVGVRNESFHNQNAVGDTFISMHNQWAPRLGVAWNVGKRGTARLFANFGRYHLPIANNTNVRLAGRELFTQEWYTFDGPIAQDGSTVLGFKIGSTTVYGDGTVKPADQVIDTTVKPMYQDEFILGFETEFTKNRRGNITYTFRHLGRAIEDITIDQGVDVPGAFHYILTNPGTDVTTRFDLDGDGTAELIELSALELGFPTPVRKYHGLTLEFRQSWIPDSYVNITYTWAHSYGNYEGLVRSDNGQTDAGITTLFDFAGLMEGAYGDLPNDRRHSVKVAGVHSWQQSWQVSASASYVHGRPKNAFGVHPTDPYAAAYGASSFYQQGRFVPRGSLGRTEGIFNVDAGVQFRKELQFHTISIKMDVFNVFDRDGVLEVREIADEATRAASPTFGLPAAFQHPRTVRISVTYEFGD